VTFLSNPCCSSLSESLAQGVAHREQLLRCISKADTVQKFRAMLLDFARVCRGEADMDTLSKYEA